MAEDVTIETPALPASIASPYAEWTPPVAVVGSAESSRRRRLIDRASGLDLRNTWQIAAGAILLPLGIGVILLGWSGAAHGRVEQQQIPYLISGGILGLAVVLIGCFFYWAHWLYRIYDQADLHHQEAMREQTEMMKAFLEAVRARPGPTVDGATNGSAALRPPISLVATPTGTNFHVPGCSMIANRSAKLRTITADEAERMRPCRVCEPLNR